MLRGGALVKHCGARGTFWNIRATVPQHYPPPDFGSLSINLVAVQTEQSSEKNLTGRWFEAVPPGQILPQDIHAAQLARRLKPKQGCEGRILTLPPKLAPKAFGARTRRQDACAT